PPPGPPPSAPRGGGARAPTARRRRLRHRAAPAEPGWSSPRRELPAGPVGAFGALPPPPREAADRWGAEATPVVSVRLGAKHRRPGARRGQVGEGVRGAGGEQLGGGEGA